MGNGSRSSHPFVGRHGSLFEFLRLQLYYKKFGHELSTLVNIGVHDVGVKWLAEGKGP